MRHISDLSRAALQRAIREGNITVNEQATKPRYIVHAGDIVRAELQTDTISSTQPTKLPAPPILYEDKDIVVIDKPAGVTVHPGLANETGTIIDWFADRYPANSGDLVHRLDKDTSGVLVLAKTSEALNHLKIHFKKRRVKKEYLALVFGVPKKGEGRVNQPLARSKRNPIRRTVPPQGLPREALAKWGKPAITEWQLEEKISDKYALLRVFPLTGRTHQIRVHLHFISHPIIGDPLYTFKRQHSPTGVTHQLLHAHQLTLTLPSGKRKTFTAPLPADFQTVLTKIN